MKIQGFGAQKWYLKNRASFSGLVSARRADARREAMVEEARGGRRDKIKDNLQSGERENGCAFCFYFFGTGHFHVGTSI